MRACVRATLQRQVYVQQCMLGHLTSNVCMLHAGLPLEVQRLATVDIHTRLAQLQAVFV